jgi:hypothetical protein
MGEDNQQRHSGQKKRAEHEFDVVVFVLAGLLTVIVVAAVGYGILNSTRIATSIPFPNTLDAAFTAVPARQSPATEGTGGPEAKPRAQ